MIDSHCHLGLNNQENIEAIIQRAMDNGVDTLITIGASDGFETNMEAVKIAREFENVFATVGIHPHDAKIVDETIYQKIEELTREKKVVAIGEIGLDFHYENSPRNQQIEVFDNFVKMAIRLKKPIVIHDRDAGFQTHDILKKNGVSAGQVLIHCFTGSIELAKKYLDLGCLLSFSGIITFNKTLELHEVVNMCPMDRMTIETDSPFLTPVPHRGKKNEPAFVKFVAEKISQIKKMSLDEVIKFTDANTRRFFHLN